LETGIRFANILGEKDRESLSRLSFNEFKSATSNEVNWDMSIVKTRLYNGCSNSGDPWIRRE